MMITLLVPYDGLEADQDGWVRLGGPGCPEVPGLMDNPDVRDFLARTPSDGLRYLKPCAISEEEKYEAMLEYGMCAVFDMTPQLPEVEVVDVDAAVTAAGGDPQDRYPLRVLGSSPDPS